MRPILVETDAGHAYIKPCIRELHPHHLIREVVGLRLAVALGLPAPLAAVVPCKGGLPSVRKGWPSGVPDLVIVDGPQLALSPLDVRSASSEDLLEGRLSDLVNPKAASKLVVLDTLLRNWDRQDARGDDGTFPETRWNNVFVRANTDRLELVAMDFGHCMPMPPNHPAFLGPELLSTVSDNGIYGLIPGVCSLIDRRELAAGLLEVRSWLAHRTASKTLMGDVPESWWFGRSEANTILKFLRERAQFLAGEDEGEGFAERASVEARLRERTP